MKRKNENYLAITVLERWEEDEQQKEERFSGFLISSNHAMFVDNHCNVLMVVKVKRTKEPLTYVTVSPITELGKLENPLNNAETIKTIAEKLNNMSAFEFIEKVICNVVTNVRFDNLIVSLGKNTTTTRESEAVAI